MQPDDRTRLLHMVEAAEWATTFVAGRQRADLDTDRMLLFALVRAIEIVGEAARLVTAEARTAIAGVPWEAIVGMRHRIVHAYFQVDHDIVWKTAVEELPWLLSALRQALSKA